MSFSPIVVTSFVAATSKKPTTSSGSSFATIVFLGVIFLLVYLMFIRPRSMAARRQRDTLMDLTPGDEVLTGAGIYGKVLDVEADRVTLETAPGTRLTVVRSTIARKIVASDLHDVIPDLESAGHDADEPGESDDEPNADGSHGADQGGSR